MEEWKERIKRFVRVVAYNKGVEMKYEDIAWKFPEIPARHICEVAESIGWPVWSSAPEEAIRPL